MIFITREENGQLILEEVEGQNLLLNAERVNDETLYKPLNPMKLKPIKPKYHHFSIEKFQEKQYITDKDEAGSVKRVYVWELNKWLETKYDHLVFEEYTGMHCINDLDESYKIKSIYITKSGELYEAWRDCHLEWKEHAGMNFIYTVDETGRVKCIYIVGHKRYHAEGDCHLEWKEHAGMNCIEEVDETGRVKSVSVVELNEEISAKHDYLEWEEYEGMHYINDIEEVGRAKHIIKRKYVFETGWIVADVDCHLEWEEYAGMQCINNVNGAGKAKGIFVLKLKKQFITEYNHLEWEEYAGMNCIIDTSATGSKVNGMERIFVMELDKWLLTHYDNTYLIKTEHAGMYCIDEVAGDRVKYVFVMKFDEWIEMYCACDVEQVVQKYIASKQ